MLSCEQCYRKVKSCGDQGYKKEKKTKKWDLYKSGLQERSNIVCHLILEVLSIEWSEWE